MIWEFDEHCYMEVCIADKNGEWKNLMKYSAKFGEGSEKKIRICFRQKVQSKIQQYIERHHFIN